MFSVSKKAQVTIYVILGVVLLFALLLVFFITNLQNENSLSQIDYSGDESIQNCFERMAKMGVEILASQGGYIYEFDETVNVDGLNVAYHIYDSEVIAPNIAFMEQELSKFQKEFGSPCLQDNDLTAFADIKGDEVVFMIESDAINTNIIVPIVLEDLFEDWSYLLTIVSLSPNFVPTALIRGNELEVININSETTIYTIISPQDIKFSFAVNSPTIIPAYINLDNQFSFQSDSIQEDNQIEIYNIGQNVQKSGIIGINLVGLSGGYVDNIPAPSLNAVPEKVAFHYSNGQDYSPTGAVIEDEISNFVREYLIQEIEDLETYDLSVQTSIGYDHVKIFVEYEGVTTTNIIPISLGRILDEKERLLTQIKENTDLIPRLMDSALSLNMVEYGDGKTLYTILSLIGTDEYYSFSFATEEVTV